MKGPKGHGVAAPAGGARFAYFLETLDQPVAREQPLWRQPLPLSRTFGVGSSQAAAGSPLSIGDYFEAVRSFLEGAGREAIADCLKKRGAEAAAAPSFRIFLAKHGEYYHPGRVEADIGGKPFCWVVNVAVSAAGRSLLPREYAALERLNREFPVGYVPEVYTAGTVDTGNGRSVDLFLGQWFPGFHEFHLTRSAAGAEPSIVLWDAETGHCLLEPGQARTVYHEVARILTHYFSLTTREGIGAWHHAAGDFVVKLGPSRPELRLITVRDYRPLFRSRQDADDACPDLKTLLETLLIFLLNLGMRTRLDRLDGTGDMAWAGPVAVEATVAGMLAALAEKPAPCELPLPLDGLFRRYLAACSSDDLLDMCLAVATKAFPPGSPELAFVEDRIRSHAEMLLAIFGRL
jgi:hypothetical protein